MTQVSSPEETIALLQDMERRSKQKAAGLSQRDNLDGAWTAIGFRVADNHFLIPLKQSREIFPVPQQVTTVPKSQPWVFGIVNLRGELLPVFDLQHFLQGKKTKVTRRSRIIVINHVDFYSGVLVDEVFGLKHFQREAEPFDTTRNLNITPFLEGSVYQHDTHWDVFSFYKLIGDSRFENAAA